jgi:glutamate N-acetyltransferase / amino-acid N-acetyltransferase
MTTTSAMGFRAAGVSAGLKASGDLDLALVVNDGPEYSAAGVFTANRVKAAPVRWSQQVLHTGIVRAVVLNSGGANACTGPAGFQDVHATAERAAAALGFGAIDVAICSTGLIGERLPIDRLLAGVDTAAGKLSADGGHDAARAIMTTDTRPKSVAISGDGYRVGGMAKGAGMLAPALATMLCALTTDAVVDASTLDGVLREACSQTFERIDSDGCLSTNDTVLLLASGASGVRPSGPALSTTVQAACADLAGQLLADAEGATKEITIEVNNAASAGDALAVARAIARNNLVKAAFFGGDPNWGRVLAAIGTTDAAFDPDAIDVAINGVAVCRAGAAAADRSTVDLSGRYITVSVDLWAGAESAKLRTNDLSLGYVHENSAYST